MSFKLKALALESPCEEDKKKSYKLDKYLHSTHPTKDQCLDYIREL